MRQLDLNFLTRLCDETHLLSSDEIRILVHNVMSVLRANRRTGKLSDYEVFVGNRFILAMSFLFLEVENANLDITQEDIDIIIEENEFLRMGNCRN